MLPVTPETFTVETGNNIQTISIHQLGDVNLWGQPSLCTITVSSFFPSENRSYAFSGGYTGNPYGAVEAIETWIREKEVVRYIISDTPVNIPVLPASISYGEEDGTGDVAYTLTLKEYRGLEAAQVQSSGSGREVENEPVQSEQSYAVQSGDTLWAIAQQYYGDGSLAWQLAGYNGIQNANLIYPGDIVKLPERSAVEASSYSGARQTAPAPSVTTDPDTGTVRTSWPKAGGGGTALNAEY